MSARNVEQLVERWLDDGPIDLPDWVVDDALAQARAVRQVRRLPRLKQTGTLGWRPRLAALAAAAVVMVAVVFGVTRLGQGPSVAGPVQSPTDSPAPPSPSTGPSASATAAEALAALPSAGEVVGEYPNPGSTDWFAATDDAIWLPDAATGSVHRVDPATGEVVATIDTGETDDPNALTVAPDGMVWVTRSESGGVARIDPATNRVVETIETGDFKPYALAHDGQRLWMTDYGATNQVGFLDPGTGELTLVDDATGGGPTGITVGGGFVWVAEVQLRSLLQIDAETAEVVGRTRVPLNGLAVAWGFDSAWMDMRRGDRLTRFDMDGEVIVTVPSLGTPGFGGGFAYGIAAGRDVVWALTGPHPDLGCQSGPTYLLALDPETNEPIASTDIPCGYGVAETADGVLVLGDRLYLIEPAA